MFTDNVCKFLPKFENYNFFNIINLVYETKAKSDAPKKSIATFRIHIITDGKGKLLTNLGETELSTGDIIIMPPAKPFAIQNEENLKYIYISYLGVRANILAEEYKITSYGSVYKGFKHLIPMWQSTLEKQRENANVCCEAVVLFSFSEIGNELFSAHPQTSADSAAKKIKELIDQRFTQSSLNVETIAAELSYNPKYVSSVFKREFNVKIVDYIRTLRIQHACTLMEQGLTSLKNIASLCGYEDSLYFSSVFKKQMGISPKEHIRNLNNK